MNFYLQLRLKVFLESQFKIIVSVYLQNNAEWNEPKSLNSFAEEPKQDFWRDKIHSRVIIIVSF